MAELNWTAEAERWLRDIFDFIAQDNPAAAMRTVETIYQKAQLLRDFPESGYRYLQRPDKHIRILLHGHYRIAYLITDAGTIDILGVFHEINRLVYDIYGLTEEEINLIEQ